MPLSGQLVYLFCMLQTWNQVGKDVPELFSQVTLKPAGNGGPERSFLSFVGLPLIVVLSPKACH